MGEEKDAGHIMFGRDGGTIVEHQVLGNFHRVGLGAVCVYLGVDALRGGFIDDHGAALVIRDG